MKRNSVNTFTEGLVCDLDPINVPNNALTDCLNGTIITYDGNEYSLQNDKGNYPLANCKLGENFIPLGIKEYGGILYIVSLNPLTGEEEIGSYPSLREYPEAEIPDSTDIDLIIDRAFAAKSDTNELDYSELEEYQKTSYFSGKKSKLNVLDKFEITTESSIFNKFETIETYVVDENLTEHLVNDTWKNNKGQYISPVAGSVFLKNKLMQFAESDSNITTFVCWDAKHADENKVLETETLSFNLIEVDGWPTATNESWQNLTNCNSGLAIDNGGIANDNLNRCAEVTYIKDSKDYTFQIASGLGSGTHPIYCNKVSGMFFGKHSYLGLPAIKGKRLSAVHITQVGSEGKQRHVGIVSDVYEYNTEMNKMTTTVGGEFQTQSIRDTYYYELPATLPNKTYWIASVGDTGIISEIILEYTEVIEEPLDCLFSFTNKLYVNDYSSIKWLPEIVESLVYKVEVKVNGESRFIEKFEHLPAKSIKDSNLNSHSILGKPGLLLEWYSDNKIISKPFTTLIKNIHINDVISAEITPIIEYNENKSIVFSKLKTSVFDSISNYNNANWNVAEDCYKFYTNPENGVYRSQSIELNVSGPIEANNDIELYYTIYGWDSSGDSDFIIKTEKANLLGMGQSIFKIDFEQPNYLDPYEDFVKESLYQIEFDLRIADETIYKSRRRKLVTSQIFSDDMFADNVAFDEIPVDKWIECYKKTIVWGDLSVEDLSTSDLPKSLWTYLEGGEDYFSRDIQFSTFISDKDYIKYDESRLSGTLHNCDFIITKSSYLTGPLWDLNENIILTDDLNKTEILPITESQVLRRSIPVGLKHKVDIITTAATVGRYSKIGNHNTPENIAYIDFDVKGDSGNERILSVKYNDVEYIYYDIYDNHPKTKDSDFVEWLGDTSTTPVPKNLSTSNITKYKIGSYCVPMDVSYQIGANSHRLTGSGNASGTHYVCPTDKGRAVKIDNLKAGHSFKEIISDVNEKYVSGYWCTLQKYPTYASFNKITANFELNIGLAFNLSYSDQINSKNIIRAITLNNLPEIPEIEIDTINNQNAKDVAEYKELTDICDPIPNEYVKGIVRTDSKKYLSGITESFRINNKVTCPSKNSSSQSVYTPYNVTFEFGSSTSSSWNADGTLHIYIGLEYHDQK